jgi:GNAT superfamily N-acetyltransferase
LLRAEGIPGEVGPKRDTSEMFRFRRPDWAIPAGPLRTDTEVRFLRSCHPDRESPSLRRIDGIGGPLFKNAHDRESMFVVATIGPHPIGYVRCSVALDDESGRTWLLDEIAVDPPHRRSGLGRELVRLVLEWAQEMGVVSCSAHPKGNRADRVAFLESVGFRATVSGGAVVFMIDLSYRDAT